MQAQGNISVNGPITVYFSIQSQASELIVTSLFLLIARQPATEGLGGTPSRSVPLLLLERARSSLGSQPSPSRELSLATLRDSCPALGEVGQLHSDCWGLKNPALKRACSVLWMLFMLKNVFCLFVNKFSVYYTLSSWSCSLLPAEIFLRVIIYRLYHILMCMCMYD